MDASESPSKRGKKSEDGLTKYQRYYQRHPEVREKNCIREQKRREGRKLAFTNTLTRTTADINSATNAVILGSNDNATNPATITSTLNSTPRNSNLEILSDVVSSLLGEQVQQPSPMIDTYNELEDLEDIRRDVAGWSRQYGGVAHWSATMDESLQWAVQERSVNKAVAYLTAHADKGRAFLRELHDFNGRLPAEKWKIRELWRIKVELVEALVKGITIIELKASILPGLCVIGYEELRSNAEDGEEDGEERDNGSESGSEEESMDDESDDESMQ
ncbi:hypothetical protein DXG01_015687 [Tephrocybe rancida]|nr:hypothetical protein DXG01_015687 [Tephrocybe rancida]